MSSKKGPIYIGKKIKPKVNRWEELIEKNLITESKHHRERIFASSAGLCERQTACLTMLPKDYIGIRKASTQFYFKIGSTFEKLMERALDRAGILIDAETRVESIHPHIKVSGRIDFVLKDPKTTQLILMELKSCGVLPSKPKESHLAQLMVYLLLTGMPKGLIWYISRSIAKWDGKLIQRVFEIKPTKEERMQVAKILARGSIFKKHGIIPDRPEKMKKYKCGFCPLIPMCWESWSPGLSGKKASEIIYNNLLMQSHIAAGELIAMGPDLYYQFLELYP